MGEKPPGPTVSFSIRLVQSQARFAEDVGSQEERFLTLFPCPAQHRRSGSPESRCDVCDAARRPHHEELSVQALTPGPGEPQNITAVHFQRESCWHGIKGRGRALAKQTGRGGPALPFQPSPASPGSRSSTPAHVEAWLGAQTGFLLFFFFLPRGFREASP